jgi:hypothetical protein
VHGYGVIIRVNTGFHGTPFWCGRSARLRLHAASLGHDTIAYYTRKWWTGKMAACGIKHMCASLGAVFAYRAL